ncbi:helix-turn-helix domain-containing protein [Sphingopyxis sp. KK2]|uniref:helix-turn-helix domain-containing protein n=1 Tax=Sphingopyxis sp. KK2 TaxID=1855727 RepID=UPI002117A050|nr:helix-turn-helix domain-containing protein [Sphingopyxis sp. KK2]
MELQLGDNGTCLGHYVLNATITIWNVKPMPQILPPAGFLHPSSPLAIEPISMRIPDACQFTGISRSTLYLLISRREIEVVKLGSATLVLTESLRKLIERRRQKSLQCE